MLYNHAAVVVEKKTYTCWEPVRQHAKVCQTLIALNVALHCYNDEYLLMWGLQNTNDLLYVLRRRLGEMFQLDGMFLKVASVAMGLPFSLSLEFFTDVTLCGIGKYKVNNLGQIVIPPKIQSVMGRGKIRLVLRDKIGLDGSLAGCNQVVRDFLKAALWFIDDRIMKAKTSQSDEVKM